MKSNHLKRFVNQLKTTTMEIFLPVALSMAIIIFFCKRADEIEFKEKYGQNKEYFKQQAKYMRGEDWKS